LEDPGVLLIPFGDVKTLIEEVKMAIAVGKHIIMLESEVTPVCPANLNWSRKMIQLFPVEVVLESKKLRSLLPCVGPELGYEIHIVRTTEEMEKLKKEIKGE
jgi:hypothetical protein